jgi:hypothetical protein
MLLLAPAVSASSSAESPSFVVIKPRQGKSSKRECIIEGKAFFVGLKQPPQGADVSGTQALLSDSRELIANDTGFVGVEIEPSGVFKLELPRQFPLLVQASAPGFEPAFIVLATCDVSLEFVLSREKQK